jgi:Flp pilus assembly protein TadD
VRKTLPIVLLFLLLGQVNCSRKNRSTEKSNANDGAAATDTEAENRAAARVYLEQGREFYRNDEDTRAVEAFQKAIKLDSELAEAHFRLGLAYDATGQEKEAEEEYRKSVDTYKRHFSSDEHDKDGEGHYNLGQTYAGLHLYSEAVREYRQATRLKPDDADIYYDLGLSLMRLAQYDEAAAAFSKSLELDPRNYRAEDSLAEAREGVNRIRTGKKHQEELLKKQKEEELKKGEEGVPASTASPAASAAKRGHTPKP